MQAERGGSFDQAGSASHGTALCGWSHVTENYGWVALVMCWQLLLPRVTTVATYFLFFDSAFTAVIAARGLPMYLVAVLCATAPTADAVVNSLHVTTTLRSLFGGRFTVNTRFLFLLSLFCR